MLAETGAQAVGAYRGEGPVAAAQRCVGDVVAGVELAERCILALTKPGDTVLDPFMGVGTTAIAAIKKRERIDFILSPGACERAH